MQNMSQRSHVLSEILRIFLITSTHPNALDVLFVTIDDRLALPGPVIRIDKNLKFI